MLPILYSFRRCPYAMRARWALLEAGLLVQWREIALVFHLELLRDVQQSVHRQFPNPLESVLLQPYLLSL